MHDGYVSFCHIAGTVATLSYFTLAAFGVLLLTGHYLSLISLEGIVVFSMNLIVLRRSHLLRRITA
jgi:hypothetical protein